MANNGYAGKVLRVDLSSGTIAPEPLNEAWARDFIGGKGLGFRYLYDALGANVAPLSPANVIALFPNVVGAATATLELLQEEPILDNIAGRGRKLQQGFRRIFEDVSIPVLITGHPNMFSFSIGVERLTDQRDWARSEQVYYERLAVEAIKRGIMPDVDPREPWFLSYSHSDADIDETLNVMEDVVRVVKR